MPKDKFEELTVKVHYEDLTKPWPAHCFRPTYEVWYSLIQNCIECGIPFSSPWEIRCKPCHTEISPTGTIYKGWRLARNRSIDNYNFYLTQIREAAILIRATPPVGHIPVGAKHLAFS